MRHSRRFIVITFSILLAFSASPLEVHAQAATAESNPLTLAHYLTTSVKSALTAANTAVSAATEKSLWTKEFVGDPAVYALGQAAIKTITNSTVNWINSGFQGSPAYATDLQGTLQDAADQKVQQFVHDFQSQLPVDSPFRDKVAQDMLRSYFRSSGKDGFYLNNPYTLKKVSPDDAAFLRGDFTKGGFQAWFETTLHPQNTPIGAQNAAQTELDRQLSALSAQVHEELGWGNGILSWRKCDSYVNVADPTPTPVDSIDILDANGKPTGEKRPIYSAKSADLTPHKTCFASHIETPGTVIAGQLNHALGLGTDSLVTADEMDEIVGALMGQLMNHVLGSDGLGGLSHQSAVSGAKTYFQQSDTAINAASTPAPTGGTTSTGGTGSGSTSIITSFLQILQNQTQQLQAYLDDWQKINTAATAAKTALATSVCVPDKEAIIASEVQPVITQSATVIGSVPNELSALDAIRSEALTATSQTGSQQAAGLAKANADYQTLLSSNTLPSAQDFSYAVDQSTESQEGDPATLITKMGQLATQATCAAP